MTSRSNWGHRTAQCCRCGRYTRIHGRWLCGTCWSYCADHDLLADYPRMRFRLTDDELVAEVQVLRAEGLGLKDIAERLGYRPRCYHFLRQRLARIEAKRLETAT